MNKIPGTPFDEPPLLPVDYDNVDTQVGAFQQAAINWNRFGGELQDPTLNLYIDSTSWTGQGAAIARLCLRALQGNCARWDGNFEAIRKALHSMLDEMEETRPKYEAAAQTRQGLVNSWIGNNGSGNSGEIHDLWDTMNGYVTDWNNAIQQAGNAIVGVITNVGYCADPTGGDALAVVVDDQYGYGTILGKFPIDVTTNDIG